MDELEGRGGVEQLRRILTERLANGQREDAANALARRRDGLLERCTKHVGSVGVRREPREALVDELAA